MKVIPTSLPDVMIIEPQVLTDARGFFMETWNQVRYQEAGLPSRFVQDNVSFSTKGVLRGLHFQNPNPQGKLLYVLHGEVFDAAVDIRVGSPTFKQWVGITLSSENRRQLYVPEGFAHGFCVISDTALFAYKCTNVYSPQAEGSVLWSDPEIGIKWPVANPLLSVKDAVAPSLAQLDINRLPVYKNH